jgi:hypothetical protein
VKFDTDIMIYNYDMARHELLFFVSTGEKFR